VTRLVWTAFGVLALSLPCSAGTDFGKLKRSERRALGIEIRAVLAATPELLEQFRAGPAQPDYSEEVRTDKARIAAHAVQLFSSDSPGFGPIDAKKRIAFFVGPNCETCQRAENELRNLARTDNVRVTVHDTTDSDALFKQLGGDVLPYYVFPEMMLRGQIPSVVLERYLTLGTGQANP